MKTLAQKPFQARSVGVKPRRPRHVPVVRCKAAIAAPAVLNDIEKQALSAYKSSSSSPSKTDALKLLKRAAYSKNIPAEVVEGALLAVEQAAAQEKSGPTPSIAGRWRLVFGTGTKFRPFQYIPVKENFVLMEDGSQALTLESSLGPFDFFIRGEFLDWRPDSGALDFQFKKVDIHFAGKKVKEVLPKTKPKTYTFFHVDPELACARSSTGGVTLLRR